MSSSSLSDLLECSVCLEPLTTNHKVLPCQHTFCVPCLEDVWAKKGPDPASVVCPECRAVCTIPLANLPCNVILNRILEGMRQSQRSSSPSTSTSPLKTPAGAGAESLSPVPSIPGNVSTNPFVSMIQTPSPNFVTASAPVLPPKPSDAQIVPRPAVPSRPAPTVPSSQRPVTSPAIRPRPRPSSTSPDVSNRSATVSHQIHRALFNYNPTKRDELALVKNELYIVFEKCEDGWFKGASMNGLKTGYFPGNYVQHIKDEPTQLLIPKKAEKSNEASSSSSTPTRGPNMDDLIDLFSSEWDSVIGTPKVSNQRVKEFQKEQAKREEEVQRLNAISSSRRAVPPANPTPARPLPPTPPGADSLQVTSTVPRYRCIMAFPSSDKYELGLKEGDIVEVITVRDDGWCKGKLINDGRVGHFPITFVQRLA